RLVGQSERIESARFSPDGKLLAVTGGSPGRFGELQIWDIEKNEMKLSLMIGYDTLYGASWSPNGKLVAVGCSDNTIRAFDPETGKQVLFSGAHNDWVLDTTFSVNSDHLISVSRDMSMKLIEVKTERFIDNITSITPGALKGGLIAVDRHPTKDELLCGGADGAVVWKAEVPEGGMYTVDFSPDGATVAAGGFDGDVRLYNAADGTLIKRFTPVQVTGQSVAVN